MAQARSRPAESAPIERDLLEPGNVERLVKKLRKDLRLTQGALAAELGVDQSTVSRWENGTPPDAEQLRALARYIAQKAVRAPLPSISQRVEVIGEVQAGAFKEAVELAHDDRLTLLLPPDPRLPGAKREAYVVRGPSMNKIYPEGSIVVCTPTIGERLHPKSGSRVLVRRRDAHGLIEMTIKEYVVDGDNRPWIWPRSDHPEHQAPLPVPDPGSDDDNEDVLITGLVIGSYRIE